MKEYSIAQSVEKTQTSFTLPQIVHNRWSRFWVFLLGVVGTMVLYQTTNRNHLFTPKLLEMSAVDDLIPLMPWTLWVYATEWIIFLVAWLMLKNDINRTRFFFAYAGILIFSTIVFIVYPVTFPRDQFPLSDFAPSFTVSVFEYFRANMDTPANCLPSLHVSSCFISALAFYKESKAKFWFFMVWATAVSISTMTTKQHYFIDVWTAGIVTAVFYYIFFVVVQYEKKS